MDSAECQQTPQAVVILAWGNMVLDFVMERSNKRECLLRNTQQHVVMETLPGNIAFKKLTAHRALPGLG